MWNEGIICDFDGNYKDSVKLGDDSWMVVIGKDNIGLQVNGSADHHRSILCT